MIEIPKISNFYLTFVTNGNDGRVNGSDKLVKIFVNLEFTFFRQIEGGPALLDRMRIIFTIFCPSLHLEIFAKFLSQN